MLNSNVNYIELRNRANKPFIIERLKIKSEHNELEELIRDIRIILNKLTPQNLQKLTQDLTNLPINNEERLKITIDLIFEYLDDQLYIQTYAQLCKLLTNYKVPSNLDQSKQITFSMILLSKCHNEFYTDIYQKINYSKFLGEIETCCNEIKKAELKELANEKLFEAKKKHLGNIVFIGELYKLKMVAETYIHECIENLFKQESDNIYLELLCKLLSIVGEDIDRSGNCRKINDYFIRLNNIIQNSNYITSRIKFMILDLIDLRFNNWIPRRILDMPRTVEEIRREIEE
jgi:translation initiation factor 4G